MNLVSTQPPYMMSALCKSLEYNCVKEVYLNAKYYLFEAMEESEDIFLEGNDPYEIGVFSDVDDKEVTFFKNVTFPGGNSYYMENPQHSSMSALFENPSNQFVRKTKTLDTVMKKRGFHSTTS